MRPIDADALINDIENNLWDWKSVDGITASTVLRQTITDIKNQPTVKAEPEHGHWIGISDGYADGYPVYDEWECSECGVVFEDEEPPYKYCPNCGVKMDEVKEE